MVCIFDVHDGRRFGERNVLLLHRIKVKPDQTGFGKMSYTLHRQPTNECNRCSAQGHEKEAEGRIYEKDEMNENNIRNFQ